jgi:threonine synthase
LKGIWKYQRWLPPIAMKNRLTRGEGQTPLVKSRRLAAMLGMKKLYFKLEAANPSGSYKDRFAAAAVSHMLQRKTRFCLATSSGNTGASLAAYCAAAGIRCFLTVVESAPPNKIRQMQVYGAEIITVRGFGLDLTVTDRVMQRLKTMAVEYNSPIQISAFAYSPVGMVGVKTIAYELAETFDTRENHVFCPAGGGGLTLAVAYGFDTWKRYDPLFILPRVHCVQPEGNNTISGPLRRGLEHAQNIAETTTTVSGLQVPNVLDGDKVIASCRKMMGNGYLVSDSSIYESQAELAAMEGIFCEPAGAVALAGVKDALARGEIGKSDSVVCLVTGHGFKDAKSSERLIANRAFNRFETVDETFDFIKSKIKID